MPRGTLGIVECFFVRVRPLSKISSNKSSSSLSSDSNNDGRGKVELIFILIEGIPKTVQQEWILIEFK